MSVFLRCFRSFFAVGFLASITFVMVHLTLGFCLCRHGTALEMPPEQACEGTQLVEVQTGRLLLSSATEKPCLMMGREAHCPSGGTIAVLPHEAGQVFGWQMEIPHAPAGIMVREELILPGPPKVWDTSSATEISPRGNVAITERCVFPNNGSISQFWSLSPGDPKGEYQIRVSINGQLTETFFFQVQ